MEQQGTNLNLESTSNSVTSTARREGHENMQAGKVTLDLWWKS